MSMSLPDVRVLRVKWRAAEEMAAEIERVIAVYAEAAAKEADSDITVEPCIVGVTSDEDELTLVVELRFRMPSMFEERVLDRLDVLINKG